MLWLGCQWFLIFHNLFLLNQWNYNRTIQQIKTILYEHFKLFKLCLPVHIHIFFCYIQYTLTAITVLSLYKSSSLEDCYGFCEYSYAFMGLVLAILQFKLWLHLKCWRLWFCLKGFEHCFLLKSSFHQRIKGGISTLNV